jgi:GT2 family glycosyltransferase
VPDRVIELASPPAKPARWKAPRPKPQIKPALSVIVVNYRRRDDATALVRQLDASHAMRSGQAEVVLVDNDDDPGPLRRYVAKHEGVRLCSLGRNRGFSRAVNEGCRLGGGEWLLLLNPDVSVPEEFLDSVIELAGQLAERDPRVGAVGFELRHSDGSAQPSAGPFPTLGNVLTGLMRSRRRRRCRQPSTEAVEVPWATGCCLLVRRACWQELGGFDEDFFLYYEDVDLCRRARATGWTVWYAPGLQVTHYHPLHSRPVSPALRLITRHALLTYAVKYWRPWQVWLLGKLIEAEARLQRRMAFWASRPDAAEHFERLQTLAADLVGGRNVRARAELLRSARALATDA